MLRSARIAGHHIARARVRRVEGLHAVLVHADIAQIDDRDRQDRAAEDHHRRHEADDDKDDRADRCITASRRALPASPDFAFIRVSSPQYEFLRLMERVCLTRDSDRRTSDRCTRGPALRCGR